jgi:AhpD family alkylhydroperoxidase
MCVVLHTADASALGSDDQAGSPASQATTEIKGREGPRVCQ